MLLVLGVSEILDDKHPLGLLLLIKKISSKKHQNSILLKNRGQQLYFLNNTNLVLKLTVLIGGRNTLGEAGTKPGFSLHRTSHLKFNNIYAYRIIMIMEK